MNNFALNSHPEYPYQEVVIVSRIQVPPEYIDTAAASELTGFAQHTIAEMCREGRIDCKKFGRTWAVNKDEILAVKRDNRGRPQGT